MSFYIMREICAKDSSIIFLTNKKNGKKNIFEFPSTSVRVKCTQKLM